MCKEETKRSVKFNTASGVLSVEDEGCEEEAASRFAMHLPLAQPSTVLPPPFETHSSSTGRCSRELCGCRDLNHQPSAAQALIKACVGELKVIQISLCVSMQGCVFQRF